MHERPRISGSNTSTVEHRDEMGRRRLFQLAAHGPLSGLEIQLVTQLIQG